MNEVENFEEFLKNWCRKNHKPIPPKGSLNKHWKEAWVEYMKTELTDNWEQYVEQYNNIPLLTKKEEKRLKKEEELKKKQKDCESKTISSDPEVEPTKTTNSWENIQKYLK